MAHKEAVLFSLQLALLMIEHHKLFSRHLKKNYDLSYSEFLVLSAIQDYGTFVPVEPLADFVILQKKTIISVLLSLEDAGLIEKLTSEEDGRRMLIGLSSKGIQVVDKAIVDLDELVRTVFWSMLSEQEFFESVRNRIRDNLDTLRGCSVKGFDKENNCDTVASVNFLIFWKAIVSKWSDITEREGGLSFSEFRILALVTQFPQLSPHEIAEQLMVCRSNVSIYVTRLVSRGFLIENIDSNDGRAKLLSATSNGNLMVNNLMPRLNELTQKVHSNSSDEDIMVLNVWHYRMYSSLKAGGLGYDE
jgi:DNA-binding MarR family transcriptional regulator